MDNRRDFLKKVAMLAGGVSATHLFPDSIAKAMAIDPKLGSTFLDAEHVVFLMQENRSFDHAFGTLKGVRGFNDPRAIRQPNGRKVWLQSQPDGTTYAPFRLDIKDSKITWMGCLPHNWTDQTDVRNQGKMNRWLEFKRSGFREFSHMPLTMGYYTRSDIPFYYSLADAFTVCDQHFCSSLTGTNPNRLYFWTGTIRNTLDDKALVWNGDSEFTGKANWKTFPERLSNLGVEWKIYQNEISSCSAGYGGQANSWLGNFGCNVMEYFPQYYVKYSKRYRDLLVARRSELESSLNQLHSDGIKEEEKVEKLKKQLEECIREQEIFTPSNFEKLDNYSKDIHNRAFVNNSAEPDYMQLESLRYQDGQTERELMIPKGDILYQFRKDVMDGNLPMVSWLTAPQLFSDHPDSPWFGAWYVSEVMDILTKNPEVWKKTIFILTYDENDGYFDHIAPFTAPNPYKNGTGKVSKGINAQMEYLRKEDQYYPDSGRESSIGLGYRVPMIIASPWTRGGWVNSQVFDHTSNLQFLERFISHKTGRNLKEDNISAWRRAVCGDLTSAFRPYNGESIAKPQFLDRTKFIESIHQAKFKEVPTGFRALLKQEADLIDQEPRNSPYFPKQESGVRDSCALPYELYVDGRWEPENGSFHISMKAGRESFKDKAAGSPFIVYSEVPFLNESGRSWNYAVNAGDTLQDSWQISSFDAGKYKMSVYGPNGFYRMFEGSSKNPFMRVRCKYEPKTAKLIFHIENYGDQKLELTIADLSYGQYPKKLQLKAGSKKEIIWPTDQQYHWYDLLVTCAGYPDYSEQFAGRMETGKASKSDPQMA